jgi:hypothetical protein
MLEKSKRKHGDINLRRYWRFFVPFTLFMALMVKHPLRFGIGELGDDGIFYGVIALICLVTAMHIHRLAGKQARRLIAVILLCAMFAGWQTFDLLILRDNGSFGGFGSYWSSSLADYEGFAWYRPRFRDGSILCHMVFERYFGNDTASITLEINRDATWYSCGM